MSPSQKDLMFRTWRGSKDSSQLWETFWYLTINLTKWILGLVPLRCLEPKNWILKACQEFLTNAEIILASYYLTLISAWCSRRNKALLLSCLCIAMCSRVCPSDIVSLMEAPEPRSWAAIVCIPDKKRGKEFMVFLILILSSKEHGST